MSVSDADGEVIEDSSNFVSDNEDVGDDNNAIGFH